MSEVVMKSSDIIFADEWRRNGVEWRIFKYEWSRNEVEWRFFSKTGNVSMESSDGFLKSSDAVTKSADVNTKSSSFFSKTCDAVIY